MNIDNTCDCKVNEILEEEYDNQVLLNTELAGEIDTLRADRDRWRNIAGIMHEFLNEGNPSEARKHYENECTKWSR